MAKRHDAPWLTNSQTETFSVYFEVKLLTPFNRGYWGSEERERSWGQSHKEEEREGWSRTWTLSSGGKALLGYLCRSAEFLVTPLLMGAGLRTSPGPIW